MLYKGTAAAAVPLHSMQFYISKVIIAPEGGEGEGHIFCIGRGVCYGYIYMQNIVNLAVILFVL